jgi:DNA replication protein DnaC
MAPFSRPSPHPLAETYDLAWMGPWPLCRFPMLHRASTGVLGPWPDPSKPQALLDALHARGLCALIGKRGTGKTQMVAWAVDHIRWYGLPCVYAYFRADDLMSYVKSWFGLDSVSRLHNQRILRTVPLLVIDECQDRFGSEFEDMSLTNIADQRYGASLPTVFIANLKPENLAKNMGPSITSRIQESGCVVEVNWDSFRQNGGAER